MRQQAEGSRKGGSSLAVFQNSKLGDGVAKKPGMSAA